MKRAISSCSGRRKSLLGIVRGLLYPIGRLRRIDIQVFRHLRIQPASRLDQLINILDRNLTWLNQTWIVTRYLIELDILSVGKVHMKACFIGGGIGSLADRFQSVK